MTRHRISQLARKYMSHDMIDKHTELPDFPDGRIRLLHAVLGQQPAAAIHKELLSLAASLVQMGLDTHDLVENGFAGGKGGLLAMRSQQLKVLAGDYFSSRFYNLLAQAGQIDTISRMSEAVCEINRAKMNLYAKMKQMRLNAEEYLHYGSEMKSGLFVALTGFMHGLYERLWPDIMDRYSRCEILLQEMQRVEQTASLEGSWGVWHILHEGSEEDRRQLELRSGDIGFVRLLIEKYAVPEKLRHLLRQSAEQLQALLQRVPSDKLMRDVQPLIEPFMKAAGLQPVLKELG